MRYSKRRGGRRSMKRGRRSFKKSYKSRGRRAARPMRIGYRM